MASSASGALDAVPRHVGFRPPARSRLVARPSPPRLVAAREGDLRASPWVAARALLRRPQRRGSVSIERPETASTSRVRAPRHPEGARSRAPPNDMRTNSSAVLCCEFRARNAPSVLDAFVACHQHSRTDSAQRRHFHAQSPARWQTPRRANASTTPSPSVGAFDPPIPPPPSADPLHRTLAPTTSPPWPRGPCVPHLTARWWWSFQGEANLRR